MNQEYTFEELIDKANKCILCAMKCTKKWSIKYWKEKADQLIERAYSMQIN